MATRLRFAFVTATVSPAIQSYTHTQTVRLKLLVTDTSALTTGAYAPDAADHIVAGDSHITQFISDPMAAGNVFTSGDLLKLCAQFLEAHAGNNLTAQVWVGIYSEDASTLRATIRSKVAPNATELATTLTSRFLSTTLSGSYTTVSGDRLVVEISATGTPTATGGVQGHNFSMRAGGDGAGGDLLENDTQTGTTLNPWIEFATTIVWPDVTVGLTGTAATTTLGTLASTRSVAMNGIAAITSAGVLTPSGGDIVPAYLLETGGTDNITLEDDSGVLLMEADQAGGGDVTGALTGSAATAAAGTLGVTHDQPVTGIAVTAVAGTVAVSHDQALTGISVTTSIGTTAPTTTIAVSGIALTTSIGTVVASGGDSPDVTVGLTGTSATISAGSLTPSTTTAISGVALTASIGILTPSANVSVSGIALTASAGSLGNTHTVTLTGTPATVTLGSVTAEGGDGGNVTVALTGTAATTSAGSLTPSASVAVSGVALTVSVGTFASATTVALTGATASIALGSVTVLGAFTPGDFTMRDRATGAFLTSDRAGAYFSCAARATGSFSISDRLGG